MANFGAGHSLLTTARWECISAPPGTIDRPADLDVGTAEWIAAAVPGTAAGALRKVGRWDWGTEDEELLDGRDWWFRCRFPAPADSGPWVLELEGLATLADVWLNGVHLLHSENMFLPHRLGVEALEPENELAIRFSALGPILAERHPRPRWKSRLVRDQSLRWYRTSLLGRMPGWSRWAAPVGPWRPVSLRRAAAIEVERAELLATPDASGPGGAVTLRAELTVRGSAPTAANLMVGEQSVPIAIEGSPGGDSMVASGEISLEAVERWWPHTHGEQPLYPVTLEVGGFELSLGRVGFREVSLDRQNGAFTIRVNGTPVFCRGTCWGPVDGVSLAPASGAVRAALERARGAGMNMLRVAGYSTYEGPEFWEACDELGIMVWQDCMLASTDPPDDPEFTAALEEELRVVFGDLVGHPALALACGSSETYQQGSMFGLPPERWRSRLLEETIPSLLGRLAPELPYVPSSPSGGPRPIVPDVGVTHYFGVGAYMRPLADSRTAGVRFAAECLSFGTPPEPETVEEVFGDARVAGHDGRWKQVVARDNGAPWDFEDVRDFYVREIFGVDPLAVRYEDPERALDLGRAAVAEAMTTVLAGWRRRGSPCAGAIVLCWQDLWPGAGWGVVDALGRAKAPLNALARVWAPLALMLHDDGLAGLKAEVVNDGSEGFRGTLAIGVWNAAGDSVDRADAAVEVGPHGAIELDVESLLGGFRDLNRAYRFAPPVHDLISAELSDADGAPVGEAIHIPGGPGRTRLTDLGLGAVAEPSGEGWQLRIETRLFAQFVAIQAPGYEPDDSWFHLPPGATRTVRLQPTGDPDRRPSGSVRALNGPATRIRVEAD